MSNWDAKLAMDYSSIVGFFMHSSVEVGELLQSFIRTVENFIRRSCPFCPG